MKSENAVTLTYARAEWLVAVRRPRTLVLNLLIPSGFAAALLVFGAPAVHASVVLTVLFSFFATFGSAIPLARDLETGRFTRVMLAGASPVSLLSQRVVVSALVDFLQLLPAAALVAFAREQAALPALLAALALALLVCNLLGAWIGALTRSLGEAALLSSVGALALLHLSGVFRTAVPGTLGHAIATSSPLGWLHESVRSGFGIATGAAVRPFAVGVVTFALVVLSFALLPRVLQRITLHERR